MLVPGFQNFMLPLLEVVKDGKDYSQDDVIDALASKVNLPEEARNEILPSGMQTRFENRVGWARTHLKKAGLVESTGRGRFRISQRGLDVLKGKPTTIDIKFLMQFPEFVEFRNVSKQENKQDEREDESNQTPEEILESSYQNLRQDLAHDLLERVKKCSPRFFERLVVDLLVAMGYGGSRKDAGQAIGQSGDGGIDGIIKEDKLGLDAVYIQAKRWDATVGRPIVQAFAGSLEGQRARKGVFITTSQFSQDAKDYVSRIEKKIVLIDGEELTQLMIDHNIGVNEVASYTVKKIDLDYFGDE
jgi:restriction system protein